MIRAISQWGSCMKIPTFVFGIVLSVAFSFSSASSAVWRLDATHTSLGYSFWLTFNDTNGDMKVTWEELITFPGVSTTTTAHYQYLARIPDSNVSSFSINSAIFPSNCSGGGADWCFTNNTGGSHYPSANTNPQ